VRAEKCGRGAARCFWQACSRSGTQRHEQKNHDLPHADGSACVFEKKGGARVSAGVSSALFTARTGSGNAGGWMKRPSSLLLSSAVCYARYAASEKWQTVLSCLARCQESIEVEEVRVRGRRRMMQQMAQWFTNRDGGRNVAYVSAPVVRTGRR